MVHERKHGINSRKIYENGGCHHLLSDHQNFSDIEECLAAGSPRYSVGPQCLHADHTITVLHNELDRRRCGWK